jgi:hypothetical protein
MNLIQIKQIDGLQTTFNSLAASIYDLDNEVQEKFDSYNGFWNQHYWDEVHVSINSEGTTVGGHDNIALSISQGGLHVYSDSYFDEKIDCRGLTSHALISGVALECSQGLNVGGNFNVSGRVYATGFAGQINFLADDGQVKRLTNIFQPSFSGVNNRQSELTPDNYIVGVNTEGIGQVSFITLPSAAEGKEIKIKDQQAAASGYNIYIQTKDDEKIDTYDTDIIIKDDGGFANFYSDGSNWFVLASSGINGLPY